MKLSIVQTTLPAGKKKRHVGLDAAILRVFPRKRQSRGRGREPSLLTSELRKTKQGEGKGCRRSMLASLAAWPGSPTWLAADTASQGIFGQQQHQGGWLLAAASRCVSPRRQARAILEMAPLRGLATARCANEYRFRASERDPTFWRGKACAVATRSRWMPRPDLRRHTSQHTTLTDLCGIALMFICKVQKKKSETSRHL